MNVLCMGCGSGQDRKAAKTGRFPILRAYGPGNIVPHTVEAGRVVLYDRTLKKQVRHTACQFYLPWVRP